MESILRNFGPYSTKAPWLSMLNVLTWKLLRLDQTFRGLFQHTNHGECLDSCFKDSTVRGSSPPYAVITFPWVLWQIFQIGKARRRKCNTSFSVDIHLHVMSRYSLCVSQLPCSWRPLCLEELCLSNRLTYALELIYKVIRQDKIIERSWNVGLSGVCVLICRNVLCRHSERGV